MSEIGSSGSPHTQCDQASQSKSTSNIEAENKREDAKAHNRNVKAYNGKKSPSIRSVILNLFSKLRNELLSKKSISVEPKISPKIPSKAIITKQPQPEAFGSLENIKPGLKEPLLSHPSPSIQKDQKPESQHKTDSDYIRKRKKVSEHRNQKIITRPLPPLSKHNIPAKKNRPLPPLPKESASIQQKPVKIQPREIITEELETALSSTSNTMSQFIQALEQQSNTTDFGYDTQHTEPEETEHNFLTVNNSIPELKKEETENLNYAAINWQNLKNNPVREIIYELENLETPITLYSGISVFLDDCQNNRQWINNKYDLNMATFKKLQSLIRDSIKNPNERNKLDTKLVKTATLIFQKQIPLYNSKEAFLWLDTFEQILLENSCPDKQSLYSQISAEITDHFDIKTPWNYQMTRMHDKGQGGLLAFELLCQQSDNDEVKMEMTRILPEDKKLLLLALKQNKKQYDAFDGDDDGVEDYAQMLALSKEESKLNKLIGSWTNETVQKANRILRDENNM